MTPAQHPVMRADREATADHALVVGRVTTRDAAFIEQGAWDHTADVQAFARHRVEATAELVKAVTDMLRHVDLSRFPHADPLHGATAKVVIALVNAEGR